MKYNILNDGDRVLNVTDNYLIIQRDNGTVDVYPILTDNSEVIIGHDPILTIGYCNDDANDCIDSFVTDNGVSIINF